MAYSGSLQSRADGGAPAARPTTNAAVDRPGAAAGAANPQHQPSASQATDWGTDDAGEWKAVVARPEYQPYLELMQAYFERP